MSFQVGDLVNTPYARVARIIAVNGEWYTTRPLNDADPKETSDEFDFDVHETELQADQGDDGPFVCAVFK